MGIGKSFASVGLIASVLAFSVASFASPTREVVSEGAKAKGTVLGSVKIKRRVRTRGMTSQRDLVVYLEPVKKSDGGFPTRVHTVRQVGLHFHPHVLPLTVGSSVQFTNEDNAVHNLFSKSGCCEIDSDMNKGEIVSKQMATPGVATVVCRIHPEMSLYLLVLETSHYTLCEIERKTVEGKKRFVAEYRLEGIEPGEYILRTWNKKLAAVEKRITVGASETRVDLELK